MATSSSSPSSPSPHHISDKPPLPPPPPREAPSSTTEIQPATAFNRFDVLTDFSRHYYVMNPPKETKNSKKRWSTNDNKIAIMREWKILARDLPPTIFVRAYETRVDLLTAVIIGAAGTPYHDGLFFFDIAFPPDYPFQPPHVHYRSHGFRINPNILTTGYVCLSLLNTSYGKTKERWNPSESSMLQVLLSIQALVLNSRPFFNDTDPFALMTLRSRDKISDDYNQDVFTMTCRTMHNVLNNPPPGFESFVREHFRQRGYELLLAIEAYANGRAQVGFYGVEEGLEPKLIKSSSTSAVSKKFRDNMRLCYAMLLEEFRSCGGASLGHLEEELRIEKKERTMTNYGMRVEEKIGIITKAFKKLKKVLGLKEKKDESGE